MNELGTDIESSAVRLSRRARIGLLLRKKTRGEGHQILPEIDLDGDFLAEFTSTICRGTYQNHYRIPQARSHHILFYLRHLYMEYQRVKDFIALYVPNSFAGSPWNWFLETSKALWQISQRGESFGLQSGVLHLRGESLLTPGEEITPDEDRLIFTMSGILTCLYIAIPTHRGSRLEPLTIQDRDPDTGYRYSAFFSNQTTSEQYIETLRELLAGLGDLIPIRQPPRKVPQEVIRHKPLYPTDLNAHVMYSTCGISIRWTSLITAHLDFDEVSKVVYLFRYPSFCLLNIPAEEGVYVKNLFKCCTNDNTAEEEEDGQAIPNYMKEILLTFHLIFAQTHKSKAMFNSKAAFADGLRADQDDLLHQLCQEPWPFHNWKQCPRRAYDVEIDFPFFGSKLDLINARLSAERPIGVKELWRDRRDSLQWYTLWAVLFIGGFGVVLSLCQTAIGLAQLVVAVRSSTPS